MDSKHIKTILKPTQVVQYYIGSPIRTNNLGFWYKSPFREERTASFLVNDNKGIHDFGTSIHYDIISFVQGLFKIDFKVAISKLYYDFHINDSEPISKELVLYKKAYLKEQNEIHDKLEKWFLGEYIKLCSKLIYIKKIIKYMQDIDSPLLPRTI